MEQSLRGICSQEYPNMRVFLLLDSASDPAMDTIRQIQAEMPNAPIEVEVMEPVFDTCSLKCNSLIQKFRKLDPRYEIVATLDGDVIPHPQWVQEMVKPFYNTSVDFVTGYRWFVPTGSLGSLVRYTWNAAAWVHVHLNGIVWGGSFAIRRTAWERCRVGDYWQRSISDDISSTESARRNHCKPVLVASNLMACREECSLWFAFRWCSRQMLMIRHATPTIWRRLCAMAGVLMLLHLASFFLIGGGIYTGNPELLNVSLAGLLLFWSGSFLFLPALEWLARSCIRKHQSPITWKWQIGFQLFFFIPLTILCFCVGMLYAMRTRIVSWRGIQYQINPKQEVKRLNYAPYEAVKQSSKSVW